jgi:hypothetical protein
MAEYFYNIPMGQNTAEELVDKANIRELIEFERYCRDYEHFDEERTLYHDDAKIWTSWFDGDVDGFINASRENAKDKKPAKHKINNILVWLNGNKAIAECICTIQFRDTLGEELVDLHSYMRLHYRVEKNSEGIWRIRSFQGIHEKDTLASAFNDGRWAPPREEVQQYRPCFWNMMYRQHVFKPKGNIPQDDSVGEDIPEKVQALYKTSSDWINESR